MGTELLNVALFPVILSIVLLIKGQSFLQIYGGEWKLLEIQHNFSLLVSSLSGLRSSDPH